MITHYGAGRQIPAGSVRWIAGAMIAAILAFADQASAAPPTYQAVGTVQSGIAALTGATAVAWPAHAINDIGLLIIQTDNQAVTLGTNGGDWNQLSNSPPITRHAGAAGGTPLARVRGRAPTTSEAGDWGPC